MKLYVAGKFESRMRLRPIRDQLQAMGYAVNSSWLDERVTREEAQARPGYEMRALTRDTLELLHSQAIILDTLDESATGGREVEWGIAYAKGLRLYRVGPIRNIYHHLAGYAFDSWAAALDFFASRDTDFRGRLKPTELRSP